MPQTKTDGLDFVKTMSRYVNIGPHLVMIMFIREMAQPAKQVQ
jgi:hypothetical protein